MISSGEPNHCLKPASDMVKSWLLLSTNWPFVSWCLQVCVTGIHEWILIVMWRNSKDHSTSAYHQEALELLGDKVS